VTLPRRAGVVATAVICAGLAMAIVVGAHESSGTSPALSGGATRLTSLQSNRYDYWSVALRAFAAEPVHGVGAGGWSVEWLKWRTVSEGAQDAHSLELQTLAELGIVGALALLAFIGGVAAAARRALDVAPAAAAGPVAALVVYLAHSPLDWDWQMPAVTLVAMVLAGGVLALADTTRPASPVAGAAEAGGAGGETDQSASAMRGASRRKIQTANPHTAT
jgi:O-antigen ligase